MFFGTFFDLVSNELPVCQIVEDYTNGVFNGDFVCTPDIERTLLVRFGVLAAELGDADKDEPAAPQGEILDTHHSHFVRSLQSWIGKKDRPAAAHSSSSAALSAFASASPEQEVSDSDSRTRTFDLDRALRDDYLGSDNSLVEASSLGRPSKAQLVPEHHDYERRRRAAVVDI